MNNLRLGFWVNLMLALLNFYLVYINPASWISPLNISAGLLCGYAAYKNRRYA